MKSSNSSRLGLAVVPLSLGLFGAVVPLVGGGFSAWGLTIAWIAAIVAVTFARVMFRPAAPTSVFVDVVLLVVTLVVLAPEGGWWFVPAVVAQLLLDRRAAGPPPSTT